MNFCKENSENSAKKDDSILAETNYQGAINTDLIDYLWSIKFNHQFQIKTKPMRVPRLKHAIQFLLPGYRCNQLLKECKIKNILSHIDFFSPIECKQIYGAPIGNF